MVTEIGNFLAAQSAYIRVLAFSRADVSFEKHAYCIILGLFYVFLWVYGVFTSILEQEFQKSGSDSNTVVRNICSFYSFVELFVREYSLFVSHGENLCHYLAVEFRVSLDCDQFSGNVHSLYGAARR